MAIRAGLDIAGYSANPYPGNDQQVVIPWIVYTDEPTQNESDIMAANVLPRRGDTLSSNTFLLASNCSLKREDREPTMWRAQITYKPDSSNQVEQHPDPTERAPDVEWDAVSYTVPAIKTAEDYIPPGETEIVPAGSPIMNSAWDLFDPTVEITDYNWIATVTKCVRTVPTWLLEMAGKVNNNPYTLDGLPIAEGASRLVNIRIGKRQRQNGYDFRELRMGIEFRQLREPRFPTEVLPLPYILELMDMGYNRRVTSLGQSAYQQMPTTKPDRILGDDNRPVAMPSHLDGYGDTLISATPATVRYRHFKIYRTADFSQLPLAA